MPSTPDLVAFTDRLADAAGRTILPHFRAALSIDNKLDGGFDPVTIADRAAEAAIREIIEADYPEHGILGEEHGNVRLDAEHVWVLDPIDGTRAFICGLPTWGTLIGFMSGGVPTFGAMDQPFVGERFHGDRESAWRQHAGTRTRLKTRACERIEDAIMCTTHPGLFQGAEKTAYDAIEDRVRTARYGTDCYGYCMVASGQVDLVIETGLQPYDIVALVPIVEGAGGVVTTWSGGSPAEGGQIVASGDPRLHEAALAQLASAAR
ncbi:histidinol-phosphatase [Stappia stellulata]|uniref:histidinol-phosphatase n=1 Tax=Stappia stellulata TaxID=71235 RepID=UPI001CD6CF04|nr:histidinol-phosphatase [Stappia stellulata]MCA1243678.1 histidinol-phosphatase [Stappia stellulata]